jgi:hypothetical protein
MIRNTLVMHRHRRLVLATVALLAIFGAVQGGATDESGSAPFPLDERLHYQISWMGIHCGRMTLESFAEYGDEDVFYHVVMTGRSSSFFDGIYKVRGRIESWYSGNQMSSIRYRDVRQEKKKHSDDLWEIDATVGSIIHTSGGEIEEIPLDADQVVDPLAYLYRLRILAGDLGDTIPLTMVTSDGAVKINAEVVEAKRIKTPFGRRDAVRVVPRAESEKLAKRGRVGIWIGKDERRTPYRLIFDLSFGKLVAKLIEVEERETEAADSS